MCATAVGAFPNHFPTEESFTGDALPTEESLREISASEVVVEEENDNEDAEVEVEVEEAEVVEAEAVEGETSDDEADVSRSVIVPLTIFGTSAATFRRKRCQNWKFITEIPKVNFLLPEAAAVRAMTSSLAQG